MRAGDRDFFSPAGGLGSDSLPQISRQDLQAMEALFENLDPESVERDLLRAKPSLSNDLLDWDLVDLIA